MKNLLALIAFSVLLLVPVGAQQVFANHPNLDCLPPGILINPFNPIAPESTNHGQTYCLSNFFPPSCPPGYNIDNIVMSISDFCTAPFLGFGSVPDPTLATQCQGAAVLLNNHCFADALASMVGGILLSIDTTGVLVAGIGNDPVITGLVAITMAGIAGQTAWFIHRRKKKILN